MWENETIVLVTSLKKRILGNEDKVFYKKIAADDAIPPFVKTRFRSFVEQYLNQEKPLTLHSTPHFDFGTDDLSNLKSRYMGEVRDYAQFLQEEVEKILKQSLTLRLKYLVKPITTLQQELFSESASCTRSHLQYAINPFEKVLPYADYLYQQCIEKNIGPITKDVYMREMGDLLKKQSEGDEVKWVLDEFSTLREFLSETQGEEVARTEGALLLDFLSDRNLKGFQKAFEVEMKLGKSDFDMVDLEITMRRYVELMNGKGMKIPAPTPPETEREPAESVAAAPETSATEPEKPKAAEETSQKTEDIWDLEEVLTEDSFPIDVGDFSEAEPEKQKQKKMGIVRREAEEETVEPKSNPPVTTGLRDMIDEKTKKLFIKKLFSGDSDSYDNLMEKLEEAESWRVAKILIDNELFKRDVDPFSKEAIRLVDLVYGRYYPEEGVGGKK